MTRRVVSVWLPYWRTDRLLRKTPELHERPLALVHAGQGGDRLIAVNEAARAQGLRPDMLLTDARAITPTLTSLTSDPDAEAQEFNALARWCGRYSPFTSDDGPDGLWLDVTGVPHLFGGEAAMLQDLQAALRRMRLRCHAGIADTPGAAWAVARFGAETLSIVPPGAQKETLSGFPVTALRLSPETTRQLEKLGLKRIGQLYDIAPGALRARFGTEVARRLSQALGAENEPIAPLTPEPDYYAVLRFPEPIGMLSDVDAVIDILAGKVTSKLATHGMGACRFVLTLYGATGGCFPVEVGISALTADPEHVKRLFREKLAVLENRFDPSFGADAFSLRAHETGVLAHHQTDLANRDSGAGDVGKLIDRLRARLGRDAVAELALRESHIPERAAVAVRAGTKSKQAACEPPAAPRPLLLLPWPEPIRAIAEVPDYPPHRFEWRRLSYNVIHAEGPERVTTEWWRENADGEYRTRDYFRVEDVTGARFWIYRLGLLERHEGAAQWFMHGLFP